MKETLKPGLAHELRFVLPTSKLVPALYPESTEFREMPGLRLTLTQAARLFDIEPFRCGCVLGSLVDSGSLAMDGDVFAAADRGRRTVQRSPQSQDAHAR